MRKACLLLLLYFVSATFPAFSQDKAAGKLTVLSPQQPSYNLANQIYVLEDKEGKLSFEDIQRPEYAEKFELAGQRGDLNVGFTYSQFWIRFQLQNLQHSSADDWYLQINYPPLDYVTFYSFDTQKQDWQERTLGDKLPFSQRDIANRMFVFPLHFTDEQPHTYYLKVRSTGTVIVPVEVLSEKHFYKETLRAETTLGIYYGIMGIMLLYNLILYAFLRDQNYLFYIITILANIVFTASLQGHTFQYIFPEYPQIASNMIPIGMALWIFGASAFGDQFLDLSRYSRGLSLSLKGLVVLAILMVIGTFLGLYNVVVRYGAAFAALTAVVLVIAGIYAWRKGNHSASYFIYAWAFYLAGMLLISAKQFGLLPNNFITQYSVQIGSVIEVILLAAALSDRYRVISNERKRAQEDAYRLQIEVNEKLETKVRERTAEINQQKEEIQAQRDNLERINGELEAKNFEINQQNEEIAAQRDSIEKQKAEIEETYHNIKAISTIGQKVAAVLDWHLLNELLYQEIGTLMDAEAFGIGIFDEEQGFIEFKGFIEKGEVLPVSYDLIDDYNCLSVWCFRRQDALLLNDYDQDIFRYTNKTQVARGSAIPKAVIYVPLMLENEPVGVMTVQSFRKQAYSDIDVTVLQSLASYIAIAIDNTRAYEIIQEKNRHITDSIRYAQTIQHAILPNTKEMRDLLTECFVIHRPKDIVSGDFYWLANVEGAEDYIFVAVIDCTGHGVPGAFMSMIGNTLLNEIVKQQHVYDPAHILELLDHAIVLDLKQQDRTNTDGMDVCLCRIQLLAGGQTQVVYAGAKRPLFYWANGHEEIQELKGDKHPIGGIFKEGKTFRNQEVLLPKGSMLYLSTDGLADQCNPEKVKFGSLRLRQMLLAGVRQTVYAQGEALQAALDAHQANAAQRDDITMIGIRL